jgi:ATP-dependent helicase/nuclease subunit B
MMKRVFLGWHQPFAGLVAEWLLNQGPTLESTLVLVPTAQSARQLKQLLAAQAGAILSPRFSTPGALMRSHDTDPAPDWLEALAWQEVLEHQATRTTLEVLFSETAHTQGEWAGGMAAEMVTLRRSLQDNGLSLRDVARRLGSTNESERWDALAKIESMADQWIENAGLKSRTRILGQGISLPDGIEQLVLAGVSELPPLVERTLAEAGIPITILVAAPESVSELFTEFGTPGEAWSDEDLEWPSPDNGSVQVHANPGLQARQARIHAATHGTPIDEIAIGTADTDAGDRIAEEFTHAGWPAYHPASVLATGGLRRWLHGWIQWLNQPDLNAMAVLLSMPHSSALIEGDCATIADSLSRLRDRWMVIHPDDLRHQFTHGNHDKLKPEALEVIGACEKLERWRKLCTSDKPADAIRHLLDALPANDSELAEILTWLDEASAQMNSSKRSASFWIELMLSHLPSPASPPPSDRLVDIHGWLELLFQPGKHLIICGLNEGRVPTSKSEDPWLGESARALLGLHTDRLRAARDAFLLQSMVSSRISCGGRVDLLCTRSNEKGEPQLPSRLLLAAKPEDAARRIQHLFRKLEPVDAKLRWETEEASLWKPPACEPPDSLSATSFRDYLACPFRYYLKHLHRMRESEPQRIEWNSRDFGNVIHDVLESWGSDRNACQLNCADDIRDWLNHQLDLQVQSNFNQRIPLAVRIQLDAIRQRLNWFSEIQAQLQQDGWEVIGVEHEFSIPIGTSTVHAKIDRIDRHRDTGEMRIIDYKTGGKSSSTSSAHRTRQIANSRLPDHISNGDPALYTRSDGKKETTYLWKDLQLPLYALAIHLRDKKLATPCYFKLGETRNDVALNPWQDFDEADLQATEACAIWVSARIADKHFWPISQKVTYDDYELLWCTHGSDEVIKETAL